MSEDPKPPAAKTPAKPRTRAKKPPAVKDRPGRPVNPERFRIITVRWDDDESRPEVDIGGMDPLVAHTMLTLAVHQLWLELPDAHLGHS